MHHKYKLDNGLTVVHQPLAGYQSLTVGVWIKVGAANETEANNGISHFIEHMLFKGTETYSAKEISLTIDKIGGEINAYTARECTCYYTKTLGEHIETAFKLLSDMVFFPTFKSAHIDVEKVVVEDEINMYEDAAEELVADVLQAITFKNHALAMPILGTKESVKRFDREAILSFYRAHYRPENMVLAVAGQYDPEELEALARHYFEVERLGDCQVFTPEVPTFNSGCTCVYKENEQVQVSIDFPGIPFEDPRSYDMTLLSNVLGGTNSSLLFQLVREEKGLTYGIYSEPSFYDQIGTLNISFGASKENVMPIVEAIAETIGTLKEALTAEVVENAKNQLKGSVMLGLEGSEHVMEWIGRVEMFAHKEKDLEAVIEKIDAIELDNVKNLYHQIFETGQCAMAVVGEMSESEVQALYERIVRGEAHES